MLSNKDLVEEDLLKQFLRIPYLHHGRTLSGADCWGGILLWYQMRLSVKLWDLEVDYPETWRFVGKSHFLMNYHRQWRAVSRPGLYDVVLFKVGEEVNHAGFYLRNDKFFHVCRAGGAIASLGAAEWKTRVAGFYHLKERNDHHH